MNDFKSPVLIKRSHESNDSLVNYDQEPIIDTRYQSYLRVYIYDLNNADTCDELNNNQENSLTKRSLIKINGLLYVSKVCVFGNIVGIYESAKYYRLQIDDSTGCINVTLWKEMIFDEDSLKYLNSSNNSNVRNQFNQIYSCLDSIKARIKEPSINNAIMYEPKQGDLVMIRATVRCYRQRVELNAVSCIRVKDSTEEIVHIMLPSILSDKVYTKPPPSLNDFNNFTNNFSKIQKVNHESQTKFDKENFVSNENFLNFVLKKLVEMSESNVLDSSRKIENNSSQSCESYALFRFLKNNCPNEFKFVNQKQVLDALKELESRGLVYSCEDEFHYLPLN